MIQRYILALAVFGWIGITIADDEFAPLVPGNHCGHADSISPYSIVIDGGSTGSRLHIFRFQQEEGPDGTATCACVRQGSSRADVPMSAFGPMGDEELDAHHVAAHMLPLFEYAAEIVPPKWYETTVVKYQATAGMRLLTEEHQTQVYDALYQGLMDSDTFVFRGMQREDIGTLSGELEGYYGAVAANYLSGLIDANLHVIEGNTDSSSSSAEIPAINDNHPIGALDMGGSSTQIVYLTKPLHKSSSCGKKSSTLSDSDAEEDPHTCKLSEYEAGKLKIHGDNFFSTSYLSYGVDQFRERLWLALIWDSQAANHSDSCETKMISYPCGFKGHYFEWNGYTFFGTGNADECTKQVQRLLPHPEDLTDNHQEQAGRVVGGIEHPPLNGKFFAMSLYFFTLDCLRELSHPMANAHAALNKAWPRPSIRELTDALEGLCSRSWTNDLEAIQHNSHEFTRAEVLPHRCFESVYMVTLLRDGFGFPPESRNITFTFLIDGSEVEWSLGMALALFSDVKDSDKTSATSGSVGNKTKDKNVTTQDDGWHANQSSTNLSVPPLQFTTMAGESG